jgi:hypothetical protein
MTLGGDRTPMSPRDVQRWLVDAAEGLEAAGVRAVFGRGPDIGGGGPSSWVSFASDVGSGRVVRAHDGTCDVDAMRHVDGGVQLRRSGPETTAADLAAVVNAITPSRRGAGSATS